MPDARLQRTRASLPSDGSYQFGHGAWGVMQCSECGAFGHAWCGIAKARALDWPSLDAALREVTVGVRPGSPLAVGAGETGKTLRVDLRSADHVVDTDVTE